MKIKQKIAMINFDWNGVAREYTLIDTILGNIKFYR